MMILKILSFAAIFLISASPVSAAGNGDVAAFTT